MNLSRPSLSLQQVKEANRAPPIKLSPTENMKKLLATLHFSLVVLDSMSLGHIFIQAHLQKIFPFPNRQWVGRSIENSSYLLEPPNEEWRRRALAKGKLILGDIVFPVEPFDPFKHDKKGQDLVSVWVHIYGLPYHL
jgi:Domain of unknown function (DUF4283)